MPPRLALTLGLLLCPMLAGAKTAVFWQQGFPAVDSQALPKETLAKALEGPDFLDSQALRRRLKAGGYDLLVLPYGSAFPAPAFASIKSYLQGGGNLLVLGGRPFAVAVEDGKPRQTLVYSKELLIHDSFEVPAQRLARLSGQVPNENYAFLDLPPIRWRRGFAFAARLSEQEPYKRIGSWGSLDARWDGLVFGAEPDGKRQLSWVSAIDHAQGQFKGSRWVLATFEAQPGFWQGEDGGRLLRRLADFAAGGAVVFRAQPSLANYRAQEQPRIDVSVDSARQRQDLEVELSLRKDGAALKTLRSKAAWAQGRAQASFELAGKLAPGLYEVRAILRDGRSVLAEHRSGFWRQDPAALSAGQAFSAGQDYLRKGGKSYPVVGTTYMSSEWHRYYLAKPNPYVFEKDFAQLEAAGLNMVRTGLWTGYDVATNPDGTAKEEALRAVEAYLLSAQRHHIPVQFCLFAFAPDVFGGKNPYLDPQALAKQESYVSSFARRFKDDPELIWDLINEPSFANPGRVFDGNVPNRDEYEAAAWHDWLLKRHGSQQAVASAWNASEGLLKDMLKGGWRIPLPEDWQLRLSWDGMYAGWNKPIAAFDYNLFAQDMFSAWARRMKGAIRSTGSRQLITAGQDAGGNKNRLLNQFFGSEVDFTDNHLWGDNDFVLWNIVSSKRLDKPNLVQETGVAPHESPDEATRLGEQAKAVLFERNCAAALGAGSAGVIEWVWNVNDLMGNDGEASIGALRSDGAEKPEADVLRSFAAFLRQAAPYFDSPKRPSVAVVLPQSLQLSIFNPMAVEATQRALRALHYDLKQAAYALPENALARPDRSPAQLIVLPSAQVLSEPAWQGLRRRVSAGATLLVTGPVEKDEYFRPAARITALDPAWKAQTLTAREVSLESQGQAIPLSFSKYRDRLDLDFLSGPRKLCEYSLGKGRILVCPYPAELNDNASGLAALYRLALRSAGVKAGFATNNEHPGLAVRRTEFSKATLYLLMSEADSAQDVRLKDEETGAELKVLLPAERSSLLLIDRRTGVELARYQPAPL